MVTIVLVAIPLFILGIAGKIRLYVDIGTQQENTGRITTCWIF
jgi:hypothetical protein